jgi:hypothetical protein
MMAVRMLILEQPVEGVVKRLDASGWRLLASG